MNSNEPKLCQGKDVFERMNYLYQASRFIARHNKVAASYYGNLMVGCAKKSVLRMEPDIKRTICKNCHSPLLPGETAKVRLVSKPVKAIKWTCLACKTTRRIPSKGANRLWIKEPESLVQIYDYTLKKDSLDNSSITDPVGSSSSQKCDSAKETKNRSSTEEKEKKT